MLIRNHKKLVRPGQWVLAKISPTSWIKRRSYDFRDRDVAYLCIVPNHAPRYGYERVFDWSYRVYWRFPFTATPGEWPCEGERYKWPWSHNAEYRVKPEDEGYGPCEAYKDGSYHVANAWDFDLLEYSGSGQPTYDEQEYGRRKKGEAGYLYEPASNDPEECPGPDYSLYFCDKCNKFVIPYSDDNGELTCACSESCTQMVHGAETADQIDRARDLADWVDRLATDSDNAGCPLKRHCGTARQTLERALSFLAYPHQDCAPNRTYLHKEDKFSFYFVRQTFHAGTWHRNYNGGLIMHGPCVEQLPGGGYKFTTYDYGQKCQRAATPEEIININWSTHT